MSGALPAPGDRRRLDEIFGVVLPESEADEPTPADPDDARRRDRELRDDVPPHSVG